MYLILTIHLVLKVLKIGLFALFSITNSATPHRIFVIKAGFPSVETIHTPYHRLNSGSWLTVLLFYPCWVMFCLANFTALAIYKYSGVRVYKVCCSLCTVKRTDMWLTWREGFTFLWWQSLRSPSI